MPLYTKLLDDACEFDVIIAGGKNLSRDTFKGNNYILRMLTIRIKLFRRSGGLHSGLTAGRCEPGALDPCS